jgi:hypothetical protein
MFAMCEHLQLVLHHSLKLQTNINTCCERQQYLLLQV